jgi:stage II sporulation protein AA (anti-sigma F factor antagonist)
VLQDLVVSDPVAVEGIGIVYLAGYLNGRDNGAVDAAVRALADLGCTHAVLDLSDVHPLCCRGLRSLLASIRRWGRRDVTLAVCGIRPSLRPVFDLLDLPRVNDWRSLRFEAASASAHVNDDVSASRSMADRRVPRPSR